MYGPGEYVFPVVYQLHSTLPTSFQLQFHPVGPFNAVHTQLGYVFHVCLNANQGVIVEAQQEIVIQEAVVPSRPLKGLQEAVPPTATHSLTPEGGLSSTLDKPAYSPGGSLRVRCCNTSHRPSRNSFTVSLRLFEDVNITVAPSKQGESSRLLCERNFQNAVDATTFELVLELPKAERSFSASFSDRRHRLTVESFTPNSSGVVKIDMALVIL
ncbi:hypothetical protein V7S43_015274 [Phytophthora oleae]|uniref:Uncharacterized protein n=1 Tax=Phytophthora oleae TaxID=2107226 RepID=A0ABD3EYG3_9STRA